MNRQATRYVVRFTGTVQGVGFRATTLSLARDLDVNGFVRNEADGSVRLDADGRESALDELLRRVRTELNHRIDDVTIEVMPGKNRSGGLHIQ